MHQNPDGTPDTQIRKEGPAPLQEHNASCSFGCLCEPRLVCNDVCASCGPHLGETNAAPPQIPLPVARRYFSELDCCNEIARRMVGKCCAHGCRRSDRHPYCFPFCPPPSSSGMRELLCTRTCGINLGSTTVHATLRPCGGKG